jgi:hypothetical protein
VFHDPEPPPHEAEPPRNPWALPLPLFHEAELPRHPLTLPLLLLFQEEERFHDELFT